jgi:alanyl-tRNA synthetase
VHEADALADGADATAAGRLVAAVLPGWDATGLKSIAARIAERPGHIAVLLGAPSPAPLVVARAAGVAVDASAVLRALLERHGGKGGGRPELAQGGGVTAPADDVLRSARELTGAVTGAR